MENTGTFLIKNFLNAILFLKLIYQELPIIYANFTIFSPHSHLYNSQKWKVPLLPQMSLKNSFDSNQSFTGFVIE